MKRKCELLKAVERQLGWQSVIGWLEGIRASLIWAALQRQNRLQAKELERRGML